MRLAETVTWKLVITQNTHMVYSYAFSPKPFHIYVFILN